MNEPELHPMGNQLGLPLNDPFEQVEVSVFGLPGIGVVSLDDVVGKHPQVVMILS